MYKSIVLAKARDDTAMHAGFADWKHLTDEFTEDPKDLAKIIKAMIPDETDGWITFVTMADCPRCGRDSVASS